MIEWSIMYLKISYIKIISLLMIYGFILIFCDMCFPTVGQPSTSATLICKIRKPPEFLFSVIRPPELRWRNANRTF